MQWLIFIGISVSSTNYTELATFAVSCNISAILWGIFLISPHFLDAEKGNATVTEVSNDIVSGKTHVCLNQTPITLSCRNNSHGCPKRNEEKVRTVNPEAQGLLILQGVHNAENLSHGLTVKQWGNTEIGTKIKVIIELSNRIP